MCGGVPTYSTYTPHTHSGSLCIRKLQLGQALFGRRGQQHHLARRSGLSSLPSKRVSLRLVELFETEAKTMKGSRRAASDFTRSKNTPAPSELQLQGCQSALAPTVVARSYPPAAASCSPAAHLPRLTESDSRWTWLGPDCLLPVPFYFIKTEFDNIFEHPLTCVPPDSDACDHLRRQTEPLIL